MQATLTYEEAWVKFWPELGRDFMTLQKYCAKAIELGTVRFLPELLETDPTRAVTLVLPEEEAAKFYTPEAKKQALEARIQEEERVYKLTVGHCEAFYQDYTYGYKDDSYKKVLYDKLVTNDIEVMAKARNLEKLRALVV
jgi:hypothetical protein